MQNTSKEQRREALAARIQQAREEFARGEVKRGTVDDLMADLAETSNSEE